MISPKTRLWKNWLFITSEIFTKKRESHDDNQFTKHETTFRNLNSFIKGVLVTHPPPYFLSLLLGPSWEVTPPWYSLLQGPFKDVTFHKDSSYNLYLPVPSLVVKPFSDTSVNDL